MDQENRKSSSLQASHYY